jgi:hypothetical protein
MDDFNFDSLRDIADKNFYSDDFSHIFTDENGNTPGYKPQDDYFSEPQDYETDELDFL